MSDERVNPYLRLPDHTTWPDPADPNGVEWRLRYATPSRGDLLVAASVMHAYGYLALTAPREKFALLRRTARSVQHPTEEKQQ